MNRKDLLATLVDILSKEEASKPPPPPARPPYLGKRPPKTRGRAVGLLGLTTTVPKRVYKAVIDHCDAEEITVSYFLRGLIDDALGTQMTDSIGRVTRKARRHGEAFPRRPDGEQEPRRRTTRMPPPPDSEPEPARPNRPKTGGRKSEFSDTEVKEYIEVFHKENPEASAHEIFNHLRREYGLRFGHTRGMKLLRSIRAESMNGKSENHG